MNWTIVLCCAFFLCTFHVQECKGFYLSYVAFWTSLKMNQLTGYSIPTLYSLKYISGFPVFFVEKLATADWNTPFEPDFGFNCCEEPIYFFQKYILFGRMSSSFMSNIPTNEMCKTLGRKTYIGGVPEDKEQLDKLKKAMKFNYKRHWITDNLPIRFCPVIDNTTQHCTTGSPIGCYFPGMIHDDFCSSLEEVEYYKKYLVFNHLDLIIRYEAEFDFQYQFRANIVSAEVRLLSLNHEGSDCSSEQPMLISDDDIPVGESLNITYTYSVTFLRNDTIKYESRWDNLFRSMAFSDLHWCELIFCILFVLLVVLVPVAVLKITLTESRLCNKIECGEDIEKQYRWELITDVVLPPCPRMWLSVLMGSVVQLVYMAIVASGFACFAALESDGRDDQMIWAMIIFIFLGAVGGYSISKKYKCIGGKKWILNVIVSCIVCSGLAISVFSALDIIMFFIDSSASIPLYTLAGFAGVLFLCFIPFTLLGSLYCYKEEVGQVKIQLKKYLETAKIIYKEILKN